LNLNNTTAGKYPEPVAETHRLEIMVRAHTHTHTRHRPKGIETVAGTTSKETSMRFVKHKAGAGERLWRDALV